MVLLSCSMMSAKATFVFVCLLIHCSAYDYDNYPLCNMLVEENVEPMDALNLSVFCMNDSLANLTWSNTNKYSLDTVNIEYRCYNSTNGEQVTETIVVELFSERHDHNTIVYIEELANEDVYCTFTGCVGLNRFGFPYAWITQTANCSSEDDVVLKSSFDDIITSSSIMTNTLVSSPLLSSISPSPYPSSILHSSVSSTSAKATFIDIANSATTTSITAVKASNTLPNGDGINSTEIATGLIAALVTLFGGTGMIILVIICLSYKGWLRKTTSVQYDYEIKQDFSYPVRSVSVYSIDNISTTGSNITVLHSLSINHSPNFPNDSSQTEGESVDIKQAVKLEQFKEKQQTNSQTEEELMDATSDCSTIAIESPSTKRNPASQHFAGYLTTNSPTHSKLCTADRSPVERGQSTTFQGTPGYIPNSCDDYIPEELSKNNTRTNIDAHLTPRTMPDPGYCDDTTESAYLSCASTSSGTNNGYLMTTFSETSEYTTRQEDFCDESKPISPLLLSSGDGYTRHHPHDISNISNSECLSADSNEESSPYIQADSTCHSLPPLNGSQECDSSYVATDTSRQQNLYSSSDDVFIDLCETTDHPSPAKCTYLPTNYVPPNTSENVSNNSNYHHSETAISRNNQSDYVMDLSNCVIPDGSIKPSNYAYSDGVTAEDNVGLDLCVVEDCNDSQVTSDGYIDHDPMSHNQTITANQSMTICDSVPLWNSGFSNPLSEMETPCVDDGYLPSCDVVESCDVIIGLVSKQEVNPQPSNPENHTISNNKDSSSHSLTHIVIQDDGYM